MYLIAAPGNPTIWITQLPTLADSLPATPIPPLQLCQPTATLHVTQFSIPADIHFDDSKNPAVVARPVPAGFQCVS